MREDIRKHEDDPVRPGFVVGVLEHARVPIVGQVDGQRVLRGQAEVDVLAKRHPACGFSKAAVRGERGYRVENARGAQEVAALVVVFA